MKVLLVHRADDLPLESSHRWDLVVDLGRAPLSTYERWRQKTGARICGLYDFCDPIDDLHRTKQLLALDRFHLFDDQGIDWWDLASYLVADGVKTSLLLHRLAKEIGHASDLDCTRPDVRAGVLREILGAQLSYLRTPGIGGRVGHYLDVFSRHDRAQLAQVMEDKWDMRHQIRRRFSRVSEAGGAPVVLLPTAYISISRTAVAYAKLVPEQRFLLVYARSSGKMAGLPANVQLAPLHAYYDSSKPRDLDSLLDRWQNLKRTMLAESQELREANELGAMNAVPAFIARGAFARDAWNNLFKRHQLAACLSADDTNVYTRLPLVLAGLRRIPAVGVHHGALDYRMAMKTAYGDAYFAKSEMERDYLTNVCRMSSEKIMLGGPHEAVAPVASGSGKGRPWLVFFTEPYEADEWRKEEVYRELLPALCSLAESCGLTLVFKLHPFESVKGHRNLLSRCLPVGKQRQIKIIAGSISADFWTKVRFAITVQSSVALECTLLGIPVFLCGWLKHRYGGYIQQYAKFGAGQIVEQCSDLKTVPQRLENYVIGGPVRQNLATAIDLHVLRKRLGVDQRCQSRETLEVI